MTAPPDSILSDADLAVLRVLWDHRGKVVGRDSIRRLAGFHDVSERRVDSCLVALRRRIGPQHLVTVRQRGWMLTPEGAVRAWALLQP